MQQNKRLPFAIAITSLRSFKYLKICSHWNGFCQKMILPRIVDEYVENRINSIALGMLIKEVTRMKVIDDVNVVDGGFLFQHLHKGC